MKSIKKLLLLSVCLHYGFIAQSSSLSSWWGKPAKKPFTTTPKFFYASIDEAHKDLTNQMRAGSDFETVRAYKPGDSTTVEEWNVHKPTLKEREIMIDALNARAKDLPGLPENIVDLIYIVDFGMDRDTFGCYYSRYDRIFINKDLFSVPSKLVHTILHEYTHYQHFLGHIDYGEYSSFNEEKRADTYAVKGADCIGCGGEIVNQVKMRRPGSVLIKKYLGKKNDDRYAQFFVERMTEALAKRGYINLKHYRDPDVISHMSKGYCPNCLASVKNRLERTSGGVAALEKRRDAERKKITGDSLGRSLDPDEEDFFAEGTEASRALARNMRTQTEKSGKILADTRSAREYERERQADAARMAEVD